MRESAKSFQDLVVWQKAHELVLEIYKLTKSFPNNELYGLTSQLRRCAVSVPANIAEGFKKRGKADKARFMNIAQGSLEETRYYLILANDLNYADTKDHMKILEEVSRLLESYNKAITASVATPSGF
ncbi:MAG TPA: four helix bundle protein [Gammaproteobacteria bacterium]